MEFGFTKTFWMIDDLMLLVFVQSAFCDGLAKTREKCLEFRGMQTWPPGTMSDYGRTL
jgi:hypothetical protein